MPKSKLAARLMIEACDMKQVKIAGRRAYSVRVVSIDNKPANLQRFTLAGVRKVGKKLIGKHSVTTIVDNPKEQMDLPWD